MLKHNSGAPVVASHRNNIFIYVGGGLGVGVLIILLVVVMFLMIIVVCMRTRRNSEWLVPRVATIRVHLSRYSTVMHNTITVYQQDVHLLLY